MEHNAVKLTWLAGILQSQYHNSVCPSPPRLSVAVQSLLQMNAAEQKPFHLQRPGVRVLAPFLASHPSGLITPVGHTVFLNSGHTESDVAAVVGLGAVGVVGTEASRRIRENQTKFSTN